MINIKQLQVSQRLHELNLSLSTGQIVHIIGPNGSGKSTLLSALAGVLPYQGQIELDGVGLDQLSLAQLAQQRAYLQQQARPAFNLTVYHYLSLSIPAQVQAKQVEHTLTEIAALLDIQDKLTSSIHHLSSGEFQRVRIAATALQVWPSLNPQGRYLLLDEPAAPLDVGHQSYLHRFIEHLAKQGLTVIMANHDLNHSLRHADQVVLLDKGRLVADGEPEQILTASLLSDVYHTEVKRLKVEGQALLLIS